jgi:VIT1/CCC1 family predicted Fe2+/Mn2+ transporter
MKKRFTEEQIIGVLKEAEAGAKVVALPLLTTAFVPAATLIAFVIATALVALAFLGGLAAKTGGAKILPGVMRITFWSALAMGVTSGVGTLFGGGG